MTAIKTNHVNLKLVISYSLYEHPGLGLMNLISYGDLFIRSQTRLLNYQIFPLFSGQERSLGFKTTCFEWGKKIPKMASGIPVCIRKSGPTAKKNRTNPYVHTQQPVTSICRHATRYLPCKKLSSAQI
jgi:hypothetical protein